MSPPIPSWPRPSAGSQARRCGDCAATFGSESAQFCESCTDAIAKLEATPAAKEEWTRRRALLPAQAEPLFARITPIALRPDGTLILTARRAARGWIARRYPEVLGALGPYELVSAREALERSP